MFFSSPHSANFFQRKNWCLFPMGWRICKCVAAAYLRLIDRLDFPASDTPHRVKKFAKEKESRQSICKKYGQT